MIKAVNLAQNNQAFRSKSSEKDANENKTPLLPNNMRTRTKQCTQKTMSAFIDYPINGLNGDVNANFYEFLTMGIVPYITGSAMFMLVFNTLNLGKYLGAKDAKAARKMGNKMAFGVVLYGLLKTLSKHLVTTPVKLATGVDTELPYQNKIYNMPKEPGAEAGVDIRWQQRKVFDSKEFFRKDLLDKEYYDNVAMKLGLGTDLNDPITETTPIIQSIVATSNAAKSLSSYSWAAVGVGLAMQDAWTDFFDSVANRKHYSSTSGESFFSKLGGKSKVFAENSWNFTKGLGKACGKSCKQLWNGSPEHGGFMKHLGKALLGVAALTTLLTTSNVILRAKNMAKNTNKYTIDKTKESTVI